MHGVNPGHNDIDTEMLDEQPLGTPELAELDDVPVYAPGGQDLANMLELHGLTAGT